jgi:hypothetical protein
MAKNFRIFTHKNDENLHLRLMGDFDGTSAHVVLDALKRDCSCCSRVFIHTSCLRNIHPLGLKVFSNNLGLLKGKPIELLFTGEHAPRLVPEKPVMADLITSAVPLIAQPEAVHMAVLDPDLTSKLSRSFDTISNGQGPNSLLKENDHVQAP